MKFVDCPICDSQDHKSIISSKDYYNKIEGTFHVNQCQECNFIFTNPIPQAEHIQKFYPDSSGYYQPVKPASTGFSYELKKKVLINYLQYPGSKNLIHKIILFPLFLFYRTKWRIQGYPKFEGNGSILDIGCSYGSFLYQLNQLGWKTKGIEMNQNAVDYGRKALQLDIDRLTLDDYDSNELFDVITMRMVLEHLERPISILKKCHSLLKPGKQLIVSVPDFSGFEAKLFKEYAYTLHLPVHFNHFTPESIRSVLKSSGFEDIKVYHQRSLNDLIGPFKYMLQDGRDKKWLRLFMSNSVVKLIFLKPFITILSYLGKTSRMTVFARKMI